MEYIFNANNPMSCFCSHKISTLSFTLTKNLNKYTTKRKKQRQKAPKPQENQQQPFYHKLSVNENKVVRNSKSDFPQFHREKLIYKGTITSGKVIFIL